MNKIAIIGGTFDPIHHGHLIGGQKIYDTGEFDEIWYMPTGNPPHKSHSISSDEHRYNMCQLAVDACSFFRVSEYELGHKDLVYTYNTLEGLKCSYPDTQFWFVIGTDSLYNIHKWYRHEDLLKNGHFIIMPRGGESLSKVSELINTYKQKYQTRFMEVDMPLIEISSTSIRERVRSHLSVQYFLPTPIIHYINEHNLYRD